MKIYEPTSTDRYLVEFASLSQAIDQALSGQLADNRNKDSYDYTTMPTNTKWTNGHTLDSIKKALVEPPPAKLAMLDALHEIEGLSKTESKRKMFYRQEDGDELDIDQYLRRSAECWTACRRTPRPTRRIIKIGINLAVSHKRTPKELHARGAALVALADAIEQTGNQVEIYAFASCKGLKPAERESIFTLQICLKEAGEPLDVSKLALSVADIGFYRIAMLALKSTCCKFEHVETYGHSTDMPEEQKRGFDIFLEQSITTTSQAQQQIKNELTKLKEAAQ